MIAPRYPELRPVIQKVLDNGWKPRTFPSLPEYPSDPETIVGFEIYKYGTKHVTFFTADDIRFRIPLYEIMFNHDFAKALWGIGELDEPTKLYYHTSNTTGFATTVNRWQHHLQQMAASDDPIAYLVENA